MKNFIRTSFVQLLTVILAMFYVIGARADTEPNNDIGQANALSLNNLQNGALSDLDLNDYYIVNVPSNGTITVEGNYSAGLLGWIYIYNFAGNQIAISGSGTGDKSVTANCVGEGYVYIRANRSSGSGDYSFTVSLTNPVNSSDVEPNGGSNPVLAIPQIQQTFNEGDTIRGQLGYNYASAGVDGYDWFYYISPRDGNVTFTATYDDGLNGWLYVYNKDGVQLATSAAGSGIKTVTANCLAQDTIIVHASQSSGCGSYIGTITTSTLPNAIDLEPNGSSNSTLAISQIQQIFQEGETISGHLGYAHVDNGLDNYDWFYYISPRNGNVTFTATYDNGLNGWIYIYNKAGVQLATSAAGSGLKTVTANCLAQDTIVVLAYQSSGCGSYIGNITTSTLPNTIDLEPNGGSNSVSAIAQIQQTFQEGETITGHLGHSHVDNGLDNYDWFYYISPRDGDVTFTATYDDDLLGWIYIYDKSGTLRATSAAGSGLKSVTANCLAQDTIVVLAYQSSGCGSYTGSVTTSSLPNAIDIEPNGGSNSVASIAQIQQTFQEGETITGHLGYSHVDNGLDSDDWFYYISPRNGNVTFSATYDDDLLGWLYIYNKAGTQLGFSAAGSGFKTVTINCLAQDTIVVRANRSSGCGSYIGSVTTSTQPYANDNEPNNALADAIFTVNSAINEGHIGYNDSDDGIDVNDWFEISVSDVPFDLEAKLIKTNTFTGWMYLHNSVGTQLSFVPFNAEDATLSYNITIAGTYYIRLNRSSGCGSYALGNFCANAPIVEISAGSLQICPGDNTTLQATTSFSTYEWLFNGSLVGSLSTYSASQPGTYQLIGYDANGCSGLSNEIEINYYSLPEIELDSNGDVDFCEGDNVELIASGSFVSYLWSNNETESSIIVDEAGTYSVVGTTADGCEVESDEINTTVYAIPEISIAALGDTILCQGEEVTLSATGVFEEIAWSNGDFGSNTIISTSGIYTATGTTSDGCQSYSNSIEVVVYNDEGPCVIDCNGDAGGTAFIDECNECVGGDTGLDACVADCNGDFGGTAFIDNCNICVGGNTGLEPCSTDCNGDLGGTAFIDNCNVCVGGNTGLEACVQDCNGDFGGTAFIDNCDVCVGGNTGLEACIQDCNGDFGGTAFIDNCDVCVGGNTGLEPCSTDCNGDLGGTAFIDNCDICVGGNTGLEPCVTDCNGDFGGTAFIDNCDVCVGGNTGLEACIQDCNGDFGGTAFIDNCDVCVGGNTGLEACIQDCNGDFGGTAFIDNCDVCVGGNTGLEACIQDCNGDFGGTAFIDNCDVCVGGNTGLEACIQDCNGDFGGTAFIDNCDVCVGGNTGLEACIQDCNGDFGGTAFIDNCDVCVGGNTGLEACTGDIPLTQVQSQFCDGVYGLIDVIICQNNVSGAQNYRWQLTPIGESPLPEYTRGYANRNLRLGWVEGISMGETYEVRVKAMVDGIWGSYGPMCIVSTAPNVAQTQLVDNYSPFNPANNSPYVLCNSLLAEYIYSADRFEWELTGPNTILVESPGYFIQLGSIPSIQVNTVYNVRVRARVDGQWGAFGVQLPIEIGAPANTQIIASQCGSTRQLNQAVAAINVCGAQQYIFRFQHDSEPERIVVRPVYTCPLWLVSAPLTPGETYNVSVKVVQAGVEGNYSTTCAITIAGPQPEGFTDNLSAYKSFETSSLTLFPNPSLGGEVRLMVDNIKEGAHDINISVYDIFGKQISTEAFGYEGTELSHVLRFNNQLATGIYTVHVVIDGNSFAVERMVVK